MKIQVNKNHYEFKKYVNKERFMSYYYQLKLIYDLNPKSILEVGIGNSLLKKQLSDKVNYKTLDIAKDLHPDIFGSVENLPLEDNSFDLVCAFQVLEHLPFKKFEKCLKEISRVSKKNVLISLPYCHIASKFELKVPLIPIIRLSLAVPRFYEKIEFKGEHYWEIGAKGYPLKKIKTVLSKYFTIKKIINPYENKYHIFFVLGKK